MNKSILKTFLFFAVFLAITEAASAEICVDCHQKVTPRVVSDWQLSKHSKNGISCSSCHGDKHTSGGDVANVQIPTPDTCEKCHDQQVRQ